MDKEFEEWKIKQNLDSFIDYNDLRDCWNAAKEISKQYWLDKAVEECRYSGDIDNEVALAMDDIADEIKELKE